MFSLSRLVMPYAYILFLKEALGEHVLPVFEDLWYGWSDYDGVDACGQNYCQYYYLASSPIDALKSSLVNSSDCSWDYDGASISVSSYVPECFIGSSADWDEILMDSNTAETQIYHVNCINSEGVVLYGQQVSVNPFYGCPGDARLSFDNETLAEGCTTTPMPCLADVVARDLSLPGVSAYGHVGFVASAGSSNPQVLEIKGIPFSRIRFIPLYGENSFSEADNFWGIKYGVENNTRITYDQAIDVLDAGLDQMNYKFTYTFRFEYYPGGTEEHPYDCKFRCDSFVYYCYDQAGLKLQNSFANGTYPKDIFADLVCGPGADQFCPVLSSEVSSVSKTADPATNVQPIIFESSENTRQNDSSQRRKMDIFVALRDIFADPQIQKAELPNLVKQYQQSDDLDLRELFVRCLCFELSAISVNAIDEEIKPILAELLWEYKQNISDNFALALVNKQLSFFVEHPICRWLPVYFSLVTDNQDEKEQKLMQFIDDHSSVAEQAGLISASRLTATSKISVEKRCRYGKLFQHHYNHNNSLSKSDKTLLKIGLWELKTHSVNERIPPSKVCR